MAWSWAERSTTQALLNWRLPSALSQRRGKLPQETLQSSIDLIQRQKQNILSGSGEGVLPPEEDLESYDGPMIVELLWGLFETAVKLEDAQDRTVIHETAVLIADSLSLDEWIEACGKGDGQN